MVKRERIGDTLHDYEYMFAKIRNEQTSNGQVVVPFSVYLYFLKPEDMKGREVIFVRGQNDDKMIAHERRDSFKGKFGSLWLRPDGSMAMQGNRYPITEIGLETLVVRLIEKGTRDKQNGAVSKSVSSSSARAPRSTADSAPCWRSSTRSLAITTTSTSHASSLTTNSMCPCAMPPTPGRPNRAPSRGTTS